MQGSRNCARVLAVAALALGTLAPGLARAQSSGLDHARALRDQGKIVEAEAAVDSLLGSLTGEDLRQARLLRAELHVTRSCVPELTPEAKDRAAAFEAARALYVELAKAPGEDAQLEVRGELDLALWRRGEGLLEGSRRSEDEALKGEARTVFAAGATELAAERARLEPIAAAAAPGPTGRSPEDRALALAWLFQAKCLAGEGRAGGGAAATTRALDEYARMNEIYGSTGEGFEGAADMAEIYREQGDAEAALGAAASARQVADACGEKLDEASLETFARATLVECRILVGRKRAGELPRAVALAEKAFALAKTVPTDEEHSRVLRLVRVAHAEGLAATGKVPQAISELEKVSEREPHGPAGELARKHLARLSGRSDAETSEAALKLAEEAAEKAQWDRTAAHARNAHALSRRENKEAQVAPRALLVLGHSYEARHRLFEASLAYEEVGRRFPGTKDLAAQAALSLVKCAEQLRATLPGPESDRACESALALLAERDPNAAKGLAPYLLGRHLLEAGKPLEAADAFDKVEASAGRLHDEALLFSAQARWVGARGKGDPVKTAAALEVAVAALSRPVANEADNGRRELAAEARLLLGEVLLAEPAQPAKALAAVDGLAAQLRDQPERRGRALLVEAHARCRLGKLGDAEAVLARLLDENLGGKKTALACRDVAAALDKEAQTQEGEARRATRRRAAELCARSLEAGGSKGVADYVMAVALEVAGLAGEARLGDLPEAWKPGEARGLFSSAAAAYEKAGASLEEGEARGFAGDWAGAQAALERGLVGQRLLLPTGKLDREALAKAGSRLADAFDLCRCRRETQSYPEALALLDEVVDASAEGSRLWWKGRLEYLLVRDARGTPEDMKEVGGVLRALERKYPDYAAAEKCGVAPRLRELARKRAESK